MSRCKKKAKKTENYGLIMAQKNLSNTAIQCIHTTSTYKQVCMHTTHCMKFFYLHNGSMQVDSSQSDSNRCSCHNGRPRQESDRQCKCGECCPACNQPRLESHKQSCPKKNRHIETIRTPDVNEGKNESAAVVIDFRILEQTRTC